MKLAPVVLLASALVVALQPAPAVAQSSPASTSPAQVTSAQGGPAGNWELTISTPQDTTTVTLALQQEGGKLTGTLSGGMGSMPVAGTASGDAVALTGEISFQGNSLQLGVDGKVEGEALNGIVRFGDFGEFPFTGKRATATTASTPPAAASSAPAAGIAAAPPADAASVAAGAAGKWNVVINIPGVGDIPATAAFTQDAAGTVAGTISGPGGDVPVTGTMTGTTLKLDFKAATPQGDIPIVMDGELTSAGLAGKASIVGMGEATWSATRIP